MKQPSVWHVLQPKWRTMLQRVREERARGGSGKLVILVSVGFVFWLAVFGVLYRILKYFRGVEELGPLLAGKLLGLVFLSFISILVLSNVITALSSFFLAKDLDLLISAPVDWLRIYLGEARGDAAALVVDGGADGGAHPRGIRRDLSGWRAVPALRACSPSSLCSCSRRWSARRSRSCSSTCSRPAAPATCSRSLRSSRPAGSSSCSASSGPSASPHPKGSATCSTSSRCSARRPRRSCRASGPPRRS